MSCNYIKIIQNYDSLIDKFLVYRSFEHKYGLSEKHPICETLFAQPANELIIQQINIKLFHTTLQREDWWKINVNSNNLKNKERYCREYIERTMDGLNFKFAGVLENGMRSLYKEVFPSVSVPFKYVDVYSEILKEFQMTKETQLFELLATLRNLIHNSGVYTHPDKTINWGNKKYLFVQNKIPDCRYKIVESYLDYYSDLNDCLVKLTDSIMSRTL